MYAFSNAFIKATVLRRPSTTNKSPYVADIMFLNGEKALAHTPALDADGLVSQGKTVLCQPCSNTNRKTSYTIECAIDEKGTIIGLKPLMANELFSRITNMQLNKEVKKNNSRFDFVSQSNGIYIEVKGVPLAHDGVAFFPHGYKKSQNEPISERAIKHLQELGKLAKEGNHAYLIFITQRADVHVMMPSHRDPFFREAYFQCLKNGVIVKCYSFKWTLEGKCFYKGEIPIRA